MHLPTSLPQLLNRSPITRSISLKFFLPESDVALWYRPSIAALVTVPKASMDENDFPPRREYEVRPCGQIRSVERVTVAKGMQRLANADFRSRVACFYARHQPASTLFGQTIHFDGTHSQALNCPRTDRWVDDRQTEPVALAPKVAERQPNNAADRRMTQTQIFFPDL